MSVNLFTDDLDALHNDELYAAIGEFASAQPLEGWRHDYTEQWDDTALKDIAAFANTFGGLLIVGVKKGQKDSACEMVGIESETEYKTRIASSIAANISTVPLYSIFECTRPDAPKKRFCIVRVRESRALHLITKKGLSPVHVRNEDETRPADSAQLRRLIERERELPLLSEKVSERAVELKNSLAIYCGYQNLNSPTWNLGVRYASPTWVRFVMIRSESNAFEMDKSHEDRLETLLRNLYPRFRDCVVQGVANQAENRGAEFYEYVAYHKNLDHEARWRITSKGDIGHAIQMNYRSGEIKEVWSVVDLAQYLLLFTRLAMEWWESLPYFGDGRLFVQLNIPGLTVLLHPKDGYFVHAFDPAWNLGRAPYERSIRKDAIILGTSPGNAANAESAVTYFTGKENPSRVAVSILNQLLRSLGHSVVWNLLESEIRSLAP